MRIDIEATRESTRRRPTRNGDDVAANSDEHRELNWKAGERRAVRAGYHRATRVAVRRGLRGLR
jgi:hypothetical protein